MQSGDIQVIPTRSADLICKCRSIVDSNSVIQRVIHFSMFSISGFLKRRISRTPDAFSDTKCLTSRSTINRHDEP